MRILLTLLCCFVVQSALAGEAVDIYQARTLVTGQRIDTRLAGFAECLPMVLVKAAADPTLARDPRVARLAKDALKLVDGFSYRDRMAGIGHHDEQGTRDRPYFLTVQFNPAKIDAALKTLGRTPWKAARPRVEVFAGMQGLAAPFLLTADGERGADQRDALVEAAEQLGLPITLADQAMYARSALSFDTLPTADFQVLEAAAKVAGDDRVLVGRLVWSDKARQWIGTWRLGADAAPVSWQMKHTTYDQAFRAAMGRAGSILAGRSPPAK